MLRFSRINNKNELVDIFKKNNIDYQFISFINANGKQDFVYMVKYDKDFYGEDVVGGYIAYNKDKTWTREEIEESKIEMCLHEPFNDGVLYEIDVYPIYKDFVEYPITNVEFIEERELLIRLIQLENKSFYDNLIK